MNDVARQWLISRAIQAAPLEACGFLVGNEVVEIRNVSLAPMRAFKMDLDQANEKLSGRIHLITGIWHTHPRGTHEPSATDLAGIKSGAILPNWAYYIVTAKGVSRYDTALYAPQANSFWGQFEKVR